MIDADQLRSYVVKPALVEANLWSQPAENLVMGTAAQESRLKYLHQLGGGPALGLWQMEPDTHDDIWANYLTYRAERAKSILDVSALLTKDASPFSPDASALIYNLRYGALMCRAHYLRKPGALPDAGDVHALARYWKRHYNTHLGAGTVDEFVENYSLVN